MTVLEERYRSVLRLLPASYRAVWEEDMVATFLASALSADPAEAEDVADLGRPSWAEVVSVVALATRLRLGGVEAPPRAFAWGAAVRTVALVGLLVNAAMSVVWFASLLWVTGAAPALPYPPYRMPGASPVELGWTLAGLLWLGAYVALVLGRRHVAQRLAIVALAPGAVLTVYDTVTAQRPPSAVLTVWSQLLVTVLLTAALVAYHRDAPPIRRTPWLVAIPVGVLLGYLPAYVWLTRPAGSILDWAGVCSVAVVLAAVVHLAGRAAGRVRPSSHWSLALALLALAALVLRATSVLDLVWSAALAANRTLVLVAVAELGAVLVLGVALAVLAARALRRLAPESTAALG